MSDHARVRIETTSHDVGRALTDLVIGLTACSAYDSNGGSFKPIHYSIAEG